MALRELISAVRCLERGESPYKLYRPIPGHQRTPVVVDVPHSGLWLPESVALPSDDDRKRRFVIPGDTGVNGVVSRLGRDLPYPILHMQVVRACVDPNRRDRKSVV